MTLQEVAGKAIEVMEKHALAADMDAGFDAGEFSGPAHDQMEQREITALAEANGFTFDEVMNEVTRMGNEEQELNRQEWA